MSLIIRYGLPTGGALCKLVRALRDSGELSEVGFVNWREPSFLSQAFVGGHNISKDYSEIKRIKRIIAHEDFDIFTFNNDVALLELESPLFYSARVSPACLPDGKQKDFTDQLTVVAGWGRTSERNPTSTALRSVIVPIWDQEDCLMAGYGSSRITSNMMCGGYPEGERDR